MNPEPFQLHKFTRIKQEFLMMSTLTWSHSHQMKMGHVHVHLYQSLTQPCLPGLRKLLINHYKASAFNRCTSQTLPLMKGEPLPIPTRSYVKAVAVHTPVAIPLHWEKKVYRVLMRDVALGVIERGPINTPVTWCSRMVMVPKHSGEPRRKVDLQALNRATVRHTRSPFLLGR